MVLRVKMRLARSLCMYARVLCKFTCVCACVRLYVCVQLLGILWGWSGRYQLEVDADWLKRHPLPGGGAFITKSQTSKVRTPSPRNRLVCFLFF